MTLPNIALIGRMGTGKSTIADALIHLHGYHRFSWARPVKTIAEMAYGPIRKDATYEVQVNGQPTAKSGREILQHVGTDALRDRVDENFWIRVGERQLETAYDYGISWVNDDTRFLNEAEFLIRRGWILVRLDLPENYRLARLTASYGRAPSTSETTHPSETEITNIRAHFAVINTAPPDTIARTILETIANNRILMT